MSFITGPRGHNETKLRYNEGLDLLYIYIIGARDGGGGFRTGGTCVSFVVAAEGNNCRGATVWRVERVEGKTAATRAKGIDNGPIISGRRRLSRHAPSSVERNGR